MLKGKKKKMTPYNQESSSAGSFNFISALVCRKSTTIYVIYAVSFIVPSL
ncbi:hypothetical protein GCM10010917_00120 [Paenibacillus physcomitrellae]|uniref:Uncharacterized protein n=1 Tax=Paenibacillus physcomitrellae TaxID=1619311 RepID=A0ABQ1FLB8_9BACL|nr:hypothetical protein GCM10010917_00120 [Paenibacillus physcomitrellae]